MFLPTREKNHSIERTLSDIIFQALREDVTIELVQSEKEKSLALTFDGVEIAPVMSESFDYPLHRFHWGGGEAEEVVAGLLEGCRRCRFERRKERLETETQTVVHGLGEPFTERDSDD